MERHIPPSFGSPTPEERIDRRRATLPDMSSNHWIHESLYRRPVAVSIETKRDGGGDREAQLQAITWLAAQCNLLGDQVVAAPADEPLSMATYDDDDGGRSRRGAAPAPAAGAGESASSSAQGPDMQQDHVFLENPAPNHPSAPPPLVDKLKGLPFLPAIIVHGQDWRFAAATREGAKTIL